jgi:hypothetical protein
MLAVVGVLGVGSVHRLVNEFGRYMQSILCEDSRAEHELTHDTVRAKAARDPRAGDLVNLALDVAVLAFGGMPKFSGHRSSSSSLGCRDAVPASVIIG